MKRPDWLHVTEEVASALSDGRPIVALESTLIAHGLPWPVNWETARAAEQAVRSTGAVPATIAVLDGRATIGVPAEQIRELAQRKDVLKAARRDLAAVLFRKRWAATTVSSTMFLAHTAGINIFATGGIGGAHRQSAQPWDISSDLTELGRTCVLVVCSGAKSILDLPRTMEILETLGVPVAGFRTNNLPAFYVRDSGLPLRERVDTAADAACLFDLQKQLGGPGMVLAQPVPETEALSEQEFAAALKEAESSAVEQFVQGPAVTPFLLTQLARLTAGRSLEANRRLIVENARLAGEVAVVMAQGDRHDVRNRGLC